MTRQTIRKQAYHRPGTAPGTYDIAATRDTPPGHIELIEYDADHYTKSDGLASLTRTQQLGARWIQIDGPPSLDVLEAVRQRYGIDPLVLEDIVNQGQRPKFNDYGNAVFITVSVPHPALMQRELMQAELPKPELLQPTTDQFNQPGHALYRQISLYVTDGLLITFMEQEAGLFDPIEDRLRRAGGRLRTRDVYFLAHALIDLAIDTLFPLIDRTAEQLEALESAIMQHPTEAMLLATHQFRSRLLVMRRIAWATREVVNEFRRHAEEVTSGAIRPFLEDAHDHIVSAVDLIETQRDIATNLIEVYLSVISNRMNDVIRVLTIIATLFIPPTFVVGVYGMNFHPDAGPLSMPELSWSFGYAGVMGIIGLSMVGMLIYFRHRGWLGRMRPRRYREMIDRPPNETQR